MGKRKVSRPESIETIRQNIRNLMDAMDWKPVDVARHCNTDARTITYILAGDRGCTIETADDIATAFGLPGWCLLIPGLQVDISKRLPALVRSYQASRPEGRDYIDGVAERESKYS